MWFRLNSSKVLSGLTTDWDLFLFLFVFVVFLLENPNEVVFRNLVAGFLLVDHLRKQTIVAGQPDNDQGFSSRST